LEELQEGHKERGEPNTMQAHFPGADTENPLQKGSYYGERGIREVLGVPEDEQYAFEGPNVLRQSPETLGHIGLASRWAIAVFNVPEELCHFIWQSE
jgi:hypothetical protein